MASPTCVKCGGTSFEATFGRVKGCDYRVQFVQCTKCGGVVGVHGFLSAPAAIRQSLKQATRSPTTKKIVKVFLCGIVLALLGRAAYLVFQDDLYFTRYSFARMIGLTSGWFFPSFPEPGYLGEEKFFHSRGSGEKPWATGIQYDSGSDPDEIWTAIDGYLSKNDFRRNPRRDSDDKRCYENDRRTLLASVRDQGNRRFVWVRLYDGKWPPESESTEGSLAADRKSPNHGDAIEPR